jgi:hypothetical protein
MKPGYYLAGAGDEAGAAGFAAGTEVTGPVGNEVRGAVAGAVCGTGTLRPSKILPVTRRDEEYARNSEVIPNNSANVHVSLNSGVLAPPAPSTV